MGLKNFKIDAWWKMSMWCGIALFAAGIFVTTSVVNQKHLVGLGVGLFLVGFSFFIAQKPFSIINSNGILTGEHIEQSCLTRIFFAIGIIVSIFFAALLIVDLADIPELLKQCGKRGNN
jgi:hypothetical protein